MDWLFEKNKNNAEHLITILANENISKEIYVKEPIRLFIELMWVKFKPRIIVFVFVPYVIYLSLLYTLTGHLLNSFLINLAEMRFMKEVCVYENKIAAWNNTVSKFDKGFNDQESLSSIMKSNQEYEKEPTDEVKASLLL